MAEDNKTYRVLSCDAGGARGILSLCFLEQFEKETGKSCHDLFDLFAGTSTGSLIAGLLSSPLEFENKKISAKLVLKEIYRGKGKEFFSEPLQHWLMFWTYYTKPKFSIGPFEEILKEYLGDINIFAKDYPRRVMIFAKDVTTSKNVFFNNNNVYDPDEYKEYISRPENRDTYGTLYKIICASGAAPIYFPPYGKFIDGGIGVYGNPVLLAILEAAYFYRWQNIEVYSIGTGIFSNRMSQEEAQRNNLGDWAKYIIGELLEDTGEQQTDIAEGLLHGEIQTNNIGELLKQADDKQTVERSLHELNRITALRRKSQKDTVDEEINKLKKSLEGQKKADLLCKNIDELFKDKTITLRRYNIDFPRLHEQYPEKCTEEQMSALSNIDAVDRIDEFVGIGRDMAKNAKFESKKVRNIFPE